MTSTMMKVPGSRIRAVNAQPLNQAGAYVLYWMNVSRRTGWNFSLQRAAELAFELDRPLVILEILTCDYPYASDRLHRFVLQGMADNRRLLADRPATYYPYVEPAAGAGKGLLVALADRACLVVTDDSPAFIFPRLIAAAGKALPLRLEAIDSNGLLPLRTAEQAYPSAYAFRRFLQKCLPQHLMSWPEADPLAELPLPQAPVTLPQTVLEHWPDATGILSAVDQFDLGRLPIDHGIAPAVLPGGQVAARQRLESFVAERLDRYVAERNHPDAEATSGLSPYLHFGHVSSHEIFAALVRREDWSPHDLAHATSGKRTGWWRMSVDAEAFLDQLVTWRELGFNMCHHQPRSCDALDSLPDWARQTLTEHSGDPRPYCYSLAELREARTHDSLWNAAQRQLLREGILHNYLRMLWGKKILEWSPTPQQALEVMFELNDRYALDGRDPNSCSGIFWCLGRYDRAWGPSRPIFGKVRYMSSENTRRKLNLEKYLQRYA